MNNLYALAWIAASGGVGMTKGQLAACMKITRRKAETLVANLMEDGLLIPCRKVHGKTYTICYVLSAEAKNTIKDTAKVIEKTLL